jgi:rod shape-determining protein MreD
VTGLRAAVVLVVGLVVQASFVSEVRLFGAHGEILLLVPIVAGLTAGAERGAVAGFAAGIAVDLLVQTPFGLTALTYCLVGYGVGALQTGVLRASWWLPMMAAMAGSAIGIVLFAVAVSVVGEVNAVNADLPNVVLAVIIWNMVLIAPAIRVGRWVEAAGSRSIVGLR